MSVFNKPQIPIQAVFDLYFNKEIRLKDLLSMLKPYKIPDDVKIDFQNSWLFSKNQIVYIDTRKHNLYILTSKGDDLLFGSHYSESEDRWYCTGMYLGQFNAKKNRFIISKDQFTCPF